MTYVWRCVVCGSQREGNSPDGIAVAGSERCCELMTLKRDFRAEGVGIGSGVRVSRDGTLHEQSKLFLPGNEDFKGPGDPDGTKGMREWHDTHQRKDPKGRGVKVGDIARRSF